MILKVLFQADGYGVKYKFFRVMIKLCGPSKSSSDAGVIPRFLLELNESLVPLLFLEEIRMYALF